MRDLLQLIIQLGLALSLERGIKVIHKMTNLAKKKHKRTQRSFLGLKKNILFCNIFINIYIYIYVSIYLYISVYIYIYLYISTVYIYILKKDCNILRSFAFFCKRTKRSSVLLHSLQKNVAFFAFFYVFCKRTLRSLRSLRSFTFLRKERKRTHRSFGSHKSPKTWEKNVKECCVL